jgi:hypothetical protein
VRRRHILLGGALALTVAISIGTAVNSHDEVDNVAQPLRHRDHVAASKDSDNATVRSNDPIRPLRDRSFLYARADGADTKTLFGSPPIRSFISDTQPDAPAASSTPELPFTYLGKAEYEGSTKVILSDSVATYLVTPGDPISDQYVLKAMDESTLTFTYLPTHQDQVLSLE